MSEESKLTRLSAHAQRRADELRRHEDEDRRRLDREWEERKDRILMDRDPLASPRVNGEAA